MWTVPWIPSSFLSCFFSLLGCFLSVTHWVVGIYCPDDASVLYRAVDKRSVRLSDTHVRRSAVRGPGRSLIVVCQKWRLLLTTRMRSWTMGRKKCQVDAVQLHSRTFLSGFVLELFRNEEEGESCILTKWIPKEMQLHRSFCCGGIGLSLWSLWGRWHILSGKQEKRQNSYAQ